MLHRQDVVHHGEHALFDFAGVAGAHHHNGLPAKVNRAQVPLAASVARRVRLETWRADDMPFWVRHPLLLLGEADEHIVHKQRRPRLFRDHANRNAVPLIGPDGRVLDEDTPSVQMRLNVLQQGLEMVRRQGLVDVPPIHPVGGGGVFHEETILGRTAREFACGDGQRP